MWNAHFHCRQLVHVWFQHLTDQNCKHTLTVFCLPHGNKPPKQAFGIVNALVAIHPAHMIPENCRKNSKAKRLGESTAKTGWSDQTRKHPAEPLSKSRTHRSQWWNPSCWRYNTRMDVVSCNRALYSENGLVQGRTNSIAKSDILYTSWCKGPDDAVVCAERGFYRCNKNMSSGNCHFSTFGVGFHVLNRLYSQNVWGSLAM